MRGRPKGWNLFQGNRNEERPRACIYCFQNIKAWLLPQFSDEDVVVVETKNITDKVGRLLLASVYMAEGNEVPPRKMRDLVTYCNQHQIPLVVGSDANAHHTLWGSTNVNGRGEELLEFVATERLEVCNVGSVPTFRTRARAEVLDITLVNSRASGLVEEWRVSDEPSLSDHMFVDFAIKGKFRSSVMRRCIRSTHWDVYDDTLANKVQEIPWKLDLSSTEELEEVATAVQSAVVTAFHEACPLKRVSKKKDNEWWNPELSSLRKEARKTFRKAILDNSEEAWEAKRHAQIRLKTAIRKAKRQSWKQFTENLEGTTPTARVVKVLKNDTIATVGVIKKPSGELTTSPVETMNCLLDALLPGSTPEEEENRCVAVGNNNHMRAEEDEIADICSSERMEQAISEFKPFKAAGRDEIFPALLQRGLFYVKRIYQSIFLACLRYGYVPRGWRGGRGVFLPKPGKTSYLEAKSFRVITLTSFQLKWLERCLLYKLTETTTIQQSLSSRQYGFKPGMSTETALHEFIWRVEKNLAAKRLSVGIFLDIVGAFDNITFNKTVEAIRRVGFPEIITRWVDFMLRNRTVTVNLHGEQVTRKIGKGSPQGGILSPFLWNCVLDPLLREYEAQNIYAQAWADDLAPLAEGTDEVQVRRRAQKIVDIAERWAHENEMQFSSSKTEVVVFTHRRKWEMRKLRVNGQLIEYSKSARLLGVTLDSKLTWKEHINKSTSKATTALMQCGRLMGKTWGTSPQISKWVYTAMVRPLLTYACVVWIGAVNKEYLRRKLRKVQRLACLMISAAYPGTPTGALEVLLDIPPIEEFLRAEALRGSHRIQRVGHWKFRRVGTFGKTSSHVDVCNRARYNLALLSMPADYCVKERVFQRNFEYTIENREDAIKTVNAGGGQTLRCFTDGSKTSKGVGSGVLIERPGSTAEVMSFCLGQLASVFQAEVFAIQMLAEKLLDLGVSGEAIHIFSDSQAAIKAISGSVVQSKTVRHCRESLNKIGDINHVSILWTPGHQGIQGNEMADKLAKQGAEAQFTGPEPFLPVPYSAVVSEVWEWLYKRWKTSWVGRLDCKRTREHVGWAPALHRKKLMSMNRVQLRLILQVLTGHCNLQRHNYTTGQTRDPTCPKCGVEEETPDHFVGRCKHYREVRISTLGEIQTSIKEIFAKNNLKALVQYLQKTDRLSEYDESRKRNPRPAVPPRGRPRRRNAVGR